jgi:hypothetical protein
MEIPKSIRGSEVRFRFESPLSDAIEQQKSQKFVQAKGLITEAMALDPATAVTVDARIALREALSGIGVPAKWMRSEEAVEKHAAALQEQQQMQQQAAMVQQAAETGEQIGAAGKSIAEAEAA